MQTPEPKGFVRARYWVRARCPEAAAETIAGELSAGTFVPVLGASEDLRRGHGARVESVAVRRELADGACEAELALAIPTDNLGASLPALYATVAGNIFELDAFEALSLIDFELPQELERCFPGPAFGVTGTRRLAGIEGRPLIGTIIKPSVGLTVERTAALAAELGAAGIDLIKDDELIADPPYSRVAERVTRVRAALAGVEARTGRPVLYAPNISGEVEHMLSSQEHAARAGAGAAVVCVNAVGLAGVLALRRTEALPIHGHRAGWGLLGRGSATSLGPAAHARFWRLAGVDQLHVGGLESKFFESDASVTASLQACLRASAHRAAMPDVSAGQWGGQLPATIEAAGGDDFIYLAGGAILGHPMGVEAGVEALRAAAQAAADGIELAEAARNSPALAASMATFGGHVGVPA